ncbi:MAG: diguanylate cyclase [Pseudoxanthomonas sp.]
MEAQAHWVVQLNRRNRTAFFALMIPVLGTHLAFIHAGLLEWSLLALQFLLYPQLVYWRARRSDDPLRAEMQNLLVDDVLLGIWVASWGFPLWISFILFIGLCLNLMIFQGRSGLSKVILAMLAGVLIAALASGLHFRPDTSPLTTGLCMLALSLYLFMFANDAYTRGLALRQSRKQLGTRIEEITSLQAQLQEQASRDPLTGLFNRRHLDNLLAQELAECRETGVELTLVMIDIDRFKAVNDNFGHLAGDKMIRALAAMLLRHAQANHLACRFGGEEFLLMMPRTPVSVALQRSEALRKEFEAMRVAFEGRDMRTTLSFGIAGFPDHGSEPTPLLQMADKALYAAKLQGRNCIVHADQLAETAGA